MGIASDWARIKGNINAALAAIAEKGVTVPSGSTSDALAGLIANIEAGGASGFAKVATGTITPSTTSNSVTIYHGLGEKPGFCIIYRTDEPLNTGYLVLSLIYTGASMVCASKSVNTYYGYFGSLLGSVDVSSITLRGKAQDGSSVKNSNFQSGVTHRWIAGVYA